MDILEHRGDSDFFFFSGHNAAEQLFSTKLKEKSNGSHAMTLTKLCSTRNERLFAALAMLWGCSSARCDAPGVFDINNHHSSVWKYYLAQGNLCFVGNLWDVTDADLDRLSIHCMRSLLASSSDNCIVEALTDARAVCKMKYAVGSATIIYGLPLRTSSG